MTDVMGPNIAHHLLTKLKVHTLTLLSVRPLVIRLRQVDASSGVGTSVRDWLLVSRLRMGSVCFRMASLPLDSNDVGSSI